jgi:hypothetical protein
MLVYSESDLRATTGPDHNLYIIELVGRLWEVQALACIDFRRWSHLEYGDMVDVGLE